MMAAEDLLGRRVQHNMADLQHIMDISRGFNTPAVRHFLKNAKLDRFGQEILEYLAMTQRISHGEAEKLLARPIHINN